MAAPHQQAGQYEGIARGTYNYTEPDGTLQQQAEEYGLSADTNRIVSQEVQVCLSNDSASAVLCCMLYAWGTHRSGASS